MGMLQVLSLSPSFSLSLSLALSLSLLSVCLPACLGMLGLTPTNIDLQIQALRCYDIPSDLSKCLFELLL